MAPDLINPDNVPQHPHIAGTINGVISPTLPDRVAFTEAPVYLHFNLTRFLDLLDPWGDFWDSIDEHFAVLEGVLHCIIAGPLPWLKVRIRKLEVEGGESDRIGELDVCMVMNPTTRRAYFFAYNEAINVWERLNSLHIFP